MGMRRPRFRPDGRFMMSSGSLRPRANRFSSKPRRRSMWFVMGTTSPESLSESTVMQVPRAPFGRLTGIDSPIRNCFPSACRCSCPPRGLCRRHWDRRAGLPAWQSSQPSPPRAATVPSRLLRWLHVRKQTRWQSAAVGRSLRGYRGRLPSHQPRCPRQIPPDLAPQWRCSQPGQAACGWARATHSSRSP